MVALDGHYYQLRASGTVTEAPDAALVPFAVVTRFRPARTVAVPASASLDTLQADLTRDPSQVLDQAEHDHH